MDAELDTQASRLSVFPLDHYDQYVSRHPEATPYHASAWLLATEKAYGHLVWVISVQKHGQLRGVLPLVEVRRPWGSGKLVSLPFCDLAGPLADETSIEETLRNAAVELARTNGLAGVDIRSGGVALEVADVRDKDQAPKVRMLMPLPNSAEALFGTFKPKLRSQIRKAEKNGLTAEVRSDSSALDDFYQVFSSNMRRLGSPVHSRLWFEQLSHQFRERMLIGIVYLRECPVGAGIVLIQGKEACIPWASTVEQYNRLAPNMLLYWTLLARACEEGCQRFDFGRSTLGEGTFRFKKQWGARPHELIWSHWQVGPDDQAPTGDHGLAYPTAVSRLRPMVEVLWSKLPLAFANWLGPKLRRYITL